MRFRILKIVFFQIYNTVLYYKYTNMVYKLRKGRASPREAPPGSVKRCWRNSEVFCLTAKVKCPLTRVRMCREYNYLMPSVVYFATGASTVRVRARSPHASELLPGKSKSRAMKIARCERRASKSRQVQWKGRLMTTPAPRNRRRIP